MLEGHYTVLLLLKIRDKNVQSTDLATCGGGSQRCLALGIHTVNMGACRGLQGSSGWYRLQIRPTVDQSVFGRRGGGVLDNQPLVPRVLVLHLRHSQNQAFLAGAKLLEL